MNLSILLLIAIIYIDLNNLFISSAKSKHKNIIKKCNCKVKEKIIAHYLVNPGMAKNLEPIYFVPRVRSIWPLFLINRQQIIKRPAIRVIFAHLVSQLMALKQSIINSIITVFTPPRSMFRCEKHSISQFRVF